MRDPALRLKPDGKENTCQSQRQAFPQQELLRVNQRKNRDMVEIESIQFGNREGSGLPAKQLKSVESGHPAGAPIRVAMIVGDDQTLHCGVKDGAHQLAEALASQGFDVDVMAPKAWSLLEVWRFAGRLRQGRYDILHVQYPSIGYRGSLGPHFLGLLGTSRAAVATLHEFSTFTKLQQLSTHIFRWSGGTILFASEFERSSFNRRLGLLGATQVVFPVVSQVPYVPSSSGRDATVVYFGQIRPNKGLEAFLDLARDSIKSGRPYEFHAIGSVSKAHEAYAQSLAATAPPQVRWSFDLSFEEVGRTLGRSFAAYLPFPDGASERRGSLAAAWFNGLPVLSLIGAATTPSIRELLIVVQNPAEALSALDDLAKHPEEWESISRLLREYSENRTWDDVAKRHAAAYRAILTKRYDSSRATLPL
jgi:glycosyltransferase involved in cell wall biosynthesis